MSPENRAVMREKAERRWQKYVERKRANIAANSPSRRVWYLFDKEIPPEMSDTNAGDF